MIDAYRELFLKPHTTTFTMAGLIARIALPMSSIGIILMISQLYDSYALAGLVSATFVLTYALISPQVSRLVDRYGQRDILPIVTIICTVGFVILIYSAWNQTGNWCLFIGAFLAGFMPSISAMVRARWTELYRDHPRLQSAYSLETVLDEVSFIIGPPLSVGLSIILFPQASLIVAILLLIIGVIILILQRATEPQLDDLNTHLPNSGSIIQLANIRLLTLLMLSMGVIVGTVDIVSVAFAEAVSQPAAASLVLSAYALGSCISGLWFGALKLSMPLHRLLLRVGIATAIATIPLAWINSIAILTCVVFVAGIFFAPTMIVAMSLVERLVPKHRLTEAMTWLLAGLNIGVALGAASAGQMLDRYGLEYGFLIALSAGAIVFILALFGNYRLRHHE
ncbi:MFS transporter [Acinetobacter bereziniae]|uniref:MFS transporter n=1 Tax=Acinetobacter bereziniae TaxID=106648 RepID=UPI000C2CAFD8|nr:MFS transporter [Acinetobacter bereziniae]ATZ63447.1 ABC transporter permease [Acinetobacter bereziniae]